MRRFNIKYVLPLEAQNVAFDLLSDFSEAEGHHQSEPYVPTAHVDSEPPFSPIAQSTLDDPHAPGASRSMRGWHLPTANSTSMWLFLDMVLPV